MSTTSVSQIDRTTTRRRLMTPDELAEYLGVSLHCVYAWSSRGGGPNVVRVGARLRYRPDDVEAWLDRVTDDRAVG
ncbi:helix-turn-helix domain-containing protein [Krasilnikoviella flava]|uniref:DNA binding domain-containing protein, excisionase family n=1 Tax=Krasilnikoviella flava TaxID=526729 RepID=A0A1T5IRI3_9MICO|nr:helix-turn-helix domain-containing protein [Krasilnikoviella flava]SKC41563.1 DNA binding domain-containing protein, excisionase family [Krasilnikoviella flava]